MKRRTKRDLGVFIGAIAIIAAIAFLNTQMQRGDLAAKMESLRADLEQKRADEGMKILSWTDIRKTTGSLRKGGRYDQALLDIDGDIVNLMGFMVPQEQFRDVTEFLLLPIPLECYFCAMPPSRDVILIQLADGETTPIYEEPILVNGRLAVHQGPEIKFFYAIQNAIVGKADESGELTKRRMKLEHMLPQHDKDPSLLLDPIPANESD